MTTVGRLGESPATWPQDQSVTVRYQRRFQWLADREKVRVELHVSRLSGMAGVLINGRRFDLIPAADHLKTPCIAAQLERSNLLEIDIQVSPQSAMNPPDDSSDPAPASVWLEIFDLQA